MKLSIIIVNWNTKNLLSKCVESIFKYGANLNYEVIVVDNASVDKSQWLLSNLKSQISNLKIILNERNLGFAKAVNQVIKLANSKERMANSRYILLLNPDTEIKENTLEKMIEFMENRPHCGILGGKILNSDGSIQLSIRKFPTLLSQIIILLKLHQLFPNLPSVRQYFSVDFDYHRIQNVDQVMGSFFMIRKKLIDEIGLFDEKFFLWFEEVDFCRRAKRAGWRIYYYSQAEIFHQKAASFSQISSLKNQWQFNKSLLYYFKKHHPRLSWLILLLLQPISLFLALVVSFFPKIKKFKKL